MLACLTNAAVNKVVFCKKYGVHVKPERWPNVGSRNILLWAGARLSIMRQKGLFIISIGLFIF